jgi:hypothetical protein
VSGWRLQAPWIVAATALLIAMVLALGVAPQWRLQAAEAGQAQRSARTALPPSAPASAADWSARLPPATERDTRIAALMRRALELGIRLPASGQRVSEDHVAGVDSHQIELTARGNYLDLHRFLDEALLADPALALDQVHLARSGPDTDELDANLRFVMLQRAQPAPGVPR